MKSAYLTVAGRYEIQEMVGTGTFSRVHRGLDQNTGQAVAIKIVTVPQELTSLQPEVDIAQLLGECQRRP